jgi:hypothetical protein
MNATAQMHWRSPVERSVNSLETVLELPISASVLIGCRDALRDGLQKRRSFSKAIYYLNECGDNLAPTEGWSDRSQNCLNDMRIVGNT